MNPSWDCGNVYFEKAFVCLLSKLLRTYSPGNALMHQIRGRNKTITWQSETDSLFAVTQLISLFTKCDFHVSQLFDVPWIKFEHG